MKKLSALLAAILVAAHTNLVAIEQTVEGEVVQQTFGNGSDINSHTNNNVSLDTHNIVINIRNNLSDIIERVPPEQAQVATELSEIAVNMVEASTENKGEVSNAKIADKLAKLSLISYQVSSTPFLVPTNKLQLLCNNNFKFAFNGQYNKHNDGVVLIVNNASTGWVVPGRVLGYVEGDSKLELQYLEYDADKESPIFHYICE